MKLLQKDTGYDQLDDNLFRNIITVRGTGETFCHVFGKTIEECEERANDLVYAYNVSPVTN